MLILSRKLNECIVIDGCVTVLGFEERAMFAVAVAYALTLVVFFQPCSCSVELTKMAGVLA